MPTLCILLPDIPEGQSDLLRDVAPDALELGPWLQAVGPVQVDLILDRRGEQVTVRGFAQVEAREDCSRCARPMTYGLRAEILVVADRRGSDEPADEAALEQEGSILYHDGSELDLGAVLREAIILEIPQLLLCRPECRGLCPSCGQDLNEASCSCAVSRSDPRWEVLKGIPEFPGDAGPSRPE